MHDGPNGAGLSRKAIMSEIDISLKRLGTDYVDLYMIHRWDYNTPIEETMEALHDVVKSGKARYIGASAMYAWQFLKANHIAEKNGWTKFVSMQPSEPSVVKKKGRCFRFVRKKKLALLHLVHLHQGG
ncbi:Aldo/keto reductase family protein [Alteribacillus bidgolensis]|uniref:Aldo/keto reductase family protein n=1 Tax=Alteribacillus bidgolensis TaxID=930129 RepID=A0A1G8NJR1_9BACI|nr:aldo/keto reductase [Alteribacillus bidgolensis]SDI80398.1 Aldo/keto reductase family protein [Alteribacillus bidgolensis]